jgi:HEXXH motif-containing protein
VPTRELLNDRQLQDLAIDVEEFEMDLFGPRCASALEAISQLSPAYYRWVGNILRQIAPWRVKRNQHPSGSGSSSQAPGLVAIGNQNHPLSLADSLIHETSHHYFYLASRLGPVDDGSDNSLYFNPLIKKHRPLCMILLAYHAFANVMAFCREALRTGGTGNTYLEQRENELERDLKALVAPLQASRALTPLGRALWEPAYQHVQAR